MSVVNTGMQCVPCYREGLIATPGQKLSAEPPFALAVLNGESVCLKHLSGEQKQLVLPTAPCVIKARIWGGLVHTLYGHFEDDEKQTGVVFCRAADGMTVEADDIVSFEVLWTEDA